VAQIRISVKAEFDVLLSRSKTHETVKERRGGSENSRRNGTKEESQQMTGNTADRRAEKQAKPRETSFKNSKRRDSAPAR
jgi:hypothetical protein